MKKDKNISHKASNDNKKKVILTTFEDSNKEYLVWRFDKVDRNGPFRFDLDREEIQRQCKKLLDIIMVYSYRTWNEIMQATHDEKGKHHFLNGSSLSKEAKERIRALHLEDDVDLIYSLAISNKERLIGLRKKEVFHVIWYDANHEFCPSKR